MFAILPLATLLPAVPAAALRQPVASDDRTGRNDGTAPLVGPALKRAQLTAAAPGAGGFSNNYKPCDSTRFDLNQIYAAAIRRQY